MLRITSLSLSIATLVTVSGCGLLTKTTSLLVNEPDNYVEAESVPTLVVPNDLDNNIVNDWIIPDIAYLPSAKLYPKGVPKPVALLSDSDPDSILIQKLGERRWMVVQRKPESVWPMLRQYLTHYGIALERNDAATGLIVSEQLNYSARASDDPVKILVTAEDVEMHDTDFLVYRVEQGIRRGTTEVHLRYASKGQNPEDLMWGSASDFGALEGKLLMQVAEFDTSGLVAETVSRVGQVVAMKPKADIVRDALGYPILILNVDADRAWATIGQALKEAQIIEPDIDEDARKFTFSVTDLISESKSGFFSRIIPGRSSNVDDEKVTLLIVTSDSSQHVIVTNSNGEKLGEEVAEQILSLVRQYAA